MKGWKNMTEQKLAAVLFDLDGTLLPMDQDVFTRAYFKLLAQRFAPEGYPAGGDDSGRLGGHRRDGQKRRQPHERGGVLGPRFEGVFGARVRTDRPKFDNFYAVEFQRAREACGFNPKAAAAVSLCRELGLRPHTGHKPALSAAREREPRALGGIGAGRLRADHQL